VPLPNHVLICAQVMKERFAVGDTPTARFLNLIKPEHLFQGAWLIADEGEKFQACLAALVLSYEQGTPEYDQVNEEIATIAALGRAIASKDVNQFIALGARKAPPLQLAKLWYERTGAR
jgi:hypothetical protein